MPSAILLYISVCQSKYFPDTYAGFQQHLYHRYPSDIAAGLPKARKKSSAINEHSVRLSPTGPKKLENPSFVERAPVDVVVKEREKIAEFANKKRILEESLEKIQRPRQGKRPIAPRGAQLYPLDSLQTPCCISPRENVVWPLENVIWLLESCISFQKMSSDRGKMPSGRSIVAFHYK
jgi:hypothetical protein